MSGAPTLIDAAEFIWREADLLDRKAYDEWLRIWDADGLYIVPTNGQGEDRGPEAAYADRLNYAYDDAAMRRMRVARLTSGQSASAQSAARTVRTVSRFILLEEGDGILQLRAAQHIAAFRRSRTHMIAADLDLTLRCGPEGMSLVKKVVHLIDAHDAVSCMGFLP